MRGRTRGQTVDQLRPNILNLANQLTILRILFVPVILILLVYSRLGAALLVFIAAGLTDGLDGLIARRFGQKTSIGGILDPVADKLLMSSSLVVLALPQMGFINAIPLWLMLLIIIRDVFLIAGSLAFILLYGFRMFPPTFYGKVSTVFQLLTVFSVLFYNWLGVRQEGLYFIFILTGLLTAVSGIQYLARAGRLSEDREA
jgi:cardiolipin synthase